MQHAARALAPIYHQTAYWLSHHVGRRDFVKCVSKQPTAPLQLAIFTNWQPHSYSSHVDCSQSSPIPKSSFETFSALLSAVACVLTMSALGRRCSAECSSHSDGHGLDHHVNMTNFQGVMATGNVLAKLKTFRHDFWDASAASDDFLSGPTDSKCGIEFTVKAKNHIFFICGLTQGGSSLAGSTHPSSVDFGIFIHSGGGRRKVGVVENNSGKGFFGHVKSGDKVEIVLNSQNKVEYRLNGQLLYVSQEAPAYPLHAKVLASFKGPFLEDLQWISKHADHPTDAF